MNLFREHGYEPVKVPPVSIPAGGECVLTGTSRRSGKIVGLTLLSDALSDFDVCSARVGDRNLLALPSTPAILFSEAYPVLSVACEWLQANQPFSVRVRNVGAEPSSIGMEFVVKVSP